MREEIKQFIVQSQAQGLNKEAVYDGLLQKGYLIDEISAAFAELTSVQNEKKDGEESQKRTITIIVTIGAILVGAGVFSFVAANWDYLSKPSKVGIIIAGVIVVNSLAFYLKEKKDYPKVGAALYLLGSIVFGSGIFLVGQIFNIRSNWPDGFMMWMLGTVVMAFLTETFIVYYLGFLVGLIAVIGQPVFLFGNLASLSSFALTSDALLIVSTTAAVFIAFNIRSKIKPEDKEYF